MSGHTMAAHGGAAAWVAAWVAMLLPMMLPAMLPALGRARRAAGEAGAGRAVRLAAVVAGYLAVWGAIGVVAYPVDRALAQVPAVVTGVVVVAAAAWQLTGAKARQLACCRMGHDGLVLPGARAAWRHGMRLGVECARCCGNLMLALVAVGAMDRRAMLVVGAAIAAERVLPGGARVARAIGVAGIVVGAVLAGRALA